MKYLLSSVVLLCVPAVFDGACEVVTVMREHGPVQINKHEYNEERDGEIFKGDMKWNADGTLRAADPVAPSAPSALMTATNENATTVPATVHIGNLGVLPRGKGRKERFFIVDTTNPGHHVEMDGINSDGYETNEAAWKAITDIQMKAQTAPVDGVTNTG